MDARASKTLDAAIRLYKSKLRQYVYSKRTDRDWGQVLYLEESILTEAQEGWAQALSEWDLKDASSKIKLSSLVGEAFYRSLRDVLDTLEDLLAGEGTLDLLNAYVQTSWWRELLPEEDDPCSSATS